MSVLWLALFVFIENYQNLNYHALAFISSINNLEIIAEFVGPQLETYND